MATYRPRRRIRPLGPGSAPPPSWDAKHTPLEKPRIFWFNPEQKWACSTPFLKNGRAMNAYLFVLKYTCAAIYNGEAKTWLVPPEKLDALRETVAKHFGDYDFEPRRERRPAPAVATVAKDYLAIFTTLTGVRPDDLPSAKVAWRRAVLILHPDHGGSADALFALNEAWTAIRDTLPSPPCA